ncbi:DMT family transporter [Paracoccus lutimaris]|uniref:Drug/metabolite transporter (DMT)-like permease n=1 Tax=Paracoccus lutimaris TaxID=1490030 RepID=A0A368Z8E3_9RHOB|nr:DMT family transporter [Paracoccus lutimaris]RCW88078.1 drug/metabolite transporter (DMT)-like permease [Paracoccus lutimaris]
MRTPFLSPNRRVRPLSIAPVRDPSMSDNLRGTVLMVLSMATFTCNDALIKAVTQTLPLYESVAIRGAAVLVMMMVVAQVQQGGVRLAVARADLGPLILRTVADIVSTVLYLLALRKMALADLSAIMQALPLAVTLAAALVFRERLGWRRLSAIGVGFAGVILILRPGTGAFDIWSAVALAAMGLIVVRDIATRQFSVGTGSSTIAFYAALTVMLSGVVLGAGEDWRQPSIREFALLMLAAVFLTVGYITAVATMRVGEVSFVAPFRYTSLVWAIVLGLLVFGEWPDMWTWTGSALVVGAGIYTILREGKLGGQG